MNARFCSIHSSASNFGHAENDVYRTRDFVIKGSNIDRLQTKSSEDCNRVYYLFLGWNLYKHTPV